MKVSVSVENSIEGSIENQRGEGDYVLRRPRPEEGYAIRTLVEQCPPLDVNSTYAYMLVGEHYSSTSVVAENASGIVGLVSAYRHPEQPHVLFVWQVAVHQSARGQGLAGRMLANILRRPSARSLRYIQTTVGPDNAGSRATFARLASSLGTSMQEQAKFSSELFGPGRHEEERLLVIGPFGSSSHGSDDASVRQAATESDARECLPTYQ